MNDPGFRCSDAARLRGDELVGTAPPATRWLLVEYPGPWHVNALYGSSIDPEMVRRLGLSAEHTNTRLLFIRRPFRRGSDPGRERLWMLLARGRQPVSGIWSVDADLETAATAMAGSLQPAEPGARPDALILVCTHGVHDLCCAVRGRPVAAALAGRWPDQTWECSHVGGDRFAANVVMLPDGAYYGDLDPGSAIDVVADHLDGAVRSDHLRGISGYPPAAQAVVRELCRARPRLDLTTLRLFDIAGDRTHGWSVRVREPGQLHRAWVDATSGPVARLTCRAAHDAAPLSYQVRELVSSRL